MIEVAVQVPEERLADFYTMFGRWLGGVDVAQADAEEPSPPVLPWTDNDEDLALAKVVWSKFSDRAKALFGTLLDNPGERVSGERLAEMHDLPNGKYGTAGVLAWPGRHSAAVNRQLPLRYEDGPVGASANYWMDAEVAALFRKVRDL